MPNIQGGKKYKSSKGAQDITPEIHEIGDDQMLGRVVRVLGNRRMLVFCNDGKQRICKVRGVLRKKRMWIGVGDVVLLSLRELAPGESTSDVSGERGDILAKYDPVHFGKLKKEPGVNPKLFIQLETMDTSNTQSAKTHLAAVGEDGEEDFFEHEGEVSSSDESDDDTKKERTGPVSRNRGLRTATANNDIDIDAI
jgi:translation initiation factor 1A